MIYIGEERGRKKEGIKGKGKRRGKGGKSGDGREGRKEREEQV